MLKRIKIRNFLSFKELDAELRLINVLIGPNMAGKSNFVDCLRFLYLALNPAAALLASTLTPNVGTPQHSWSPLRYAFNYLGGFSEAVWKGGSASEIEIWIEIEAYPPVAESRRTYEYGFVVEGSGYGQISVVEERLVVKIDSKAETLLERSRDNVRYKHGSSMTESRVTEWERLAAQYISFPGSEFDRFRAIILSSRFFSLIPQMMKVPNQPNPQSFLFDSGANLSSWLLTLQGYPEYKRIIRVFMDFFPDVEDVIFQPMENTMIQLGIRQKDLNRPVALRRISEGALTFLALLSLIYAPSEHGGLLYCVEHPEAHLHPRLIEALIDLLKQRQEELEEKFEPKLKGAKQRRSQSAARGQQANGGMTQVVLTTHSPLLIDHVDLEDIIVVRRVEGASEFYRPSSSKELRKSLADTELSLGEIWYSGLLAEGA